METTDQICSCGTGLPATCCCDYDQQIGSAATPGDGNDIPADGRNPSDGAGDGRIGDGRISDTAAHAENMQAFAQQIEKAQKAWQENDPATAERLALRVLKVAPRQLDMLRLLSMIRESERKPQATRVLLRRIIAAAPTALNAMNRLALLELRQGNVDAAEVQARAAVRLAPDRPQAHNLMAMVMTQREFGVVGEYHCRRALELSGKRIPLVLSNLALNLRNQGKIDEARDAYREALALEPKSRKTWLGLARLEEADRQLDAAHAALDELARVRPGKDPAATLLRATVLGRQKRYDEALALLETAEGEERAQLRPMERLERGRLLDRLGRYDEAWTDFQAAKARVREMSGRVYREAEAREHADQLKSFFERRRLDVLPRAETRTDMGQPIFILGFPRSGTTLLEQTLSASDHIAAGDELPLIHELVAISQRLLNSPLPFPAALAELWMGDRRYGLETMRDHYLTRAQQLGVLQRSTTLFTDKMPLNEVHTGLIALVFPQAPLLHVIRHPLDIMVSAMSNFFTHGANCSNALDSAAKHLLLSHELVEHYRGEMDLNYLPVRYEDIVDDQEATIREVFDFVDVPFDPAVLEFEGNRRYARTASYAQVTEKLYDRSRYRYRNYLPHLEPVVPMLQPLIERLGYRVE
ncbi:tetratricopeptide repeat-containing sulfotransferase family protein [Microbaculum marinum]|uniref:Sulfotransferase n=1 Tax=Microbaculum marinum TaxID=1764581 RepID=A0AAW9RWG1_9HYPH